MHEALLFVDERLFEDAEMSQHVPQDDEDQHGAKASAAKFLGAISGCDASQKFAHRDPRFAKGDTSGVAEVPTGSATAEDSIGFLTLRKRTVTCLVGA